MKAFLWQKDLTKNILKSKWNKYWAVLQDYTLYIYSDQKEMTTIQEPLILYGQKVGPPEAKCTKKHSFRLTGSRCDVLLAAESNEQRQKWMSALNFAATGYKEISSNVERRSGPDLTKITTGPVSRRDQTPLTEKPSMSQKSMSVENINKLKPVLMKNINLEKKATPGLSKSDILNVWREGVKKDDSHSKPPRPKSFLESDF